MKRRGYQDKQNQVSRERILDRTKNFSMFEECIPRRARPRHFALPVDPRRRPPYYSWGLMTLHFSPLRTLLLLGLCAWLSLLIGRSAAQGGSAAQAKAPIAHFTDIAAKAGLAAPVVFGGEKTKKYIIETTGTGVAIFDYDNDGWPDIFIVNGAKLEGFAPG